MSNHGDWRAADTLGQLLERKRSLLSPYEASYLDVLLADVRHVPAQAYAGASAMIRAAPKADFPVYLTASYANTMNKPHEAVALLERVDPEGGALRGRVYYFEYLCSALHAIGDHARELEAAKRGRRQYANRLFVVFFEAHALAALGRTDELEALLRESRAMTPDLRITASAVFIAAIYELRAHEHPDAALAVGNELLGLLAAKSPRETAPREARVERARALVATHRWGDLHFLADSLWAADPKNIDAIGFRALAKAEMGDRVGALQSVAAIEDVTRPGRDNPAEEWRATIAAALGQKAEALAHLEQGHPDGSVPDYRWHEDILYELLRDYPPFQEYIRPKG